MKREFASLALIAGLFIAGTAPVSAQMWFFPDYAVPSSFGMPSTFFAASYARGLNDASGKVDAYGAAVGRTMEKVSFVGGAGVVQTGADNEVTVGGSVGVDVMNGESTTVSVQGGLGWMSPGNTTMIRVPIGVALKGRFDSGEAVVSPWAMPRINYTRVSTDLGSGSSTDLGLSGGVAFNFAGGFGVHTALDVLIGDGAQPVTFGIGGHYVVR